MVSLVQNVLEKISNDAKTMVLCLDGTSCCKKTSILAATGYVDVLKVQKNRRFLNTNSFAPSMLGYISTGILDIMSTSEPNFMDRSPLNPIEWHFLWKFIDNFYNDFGNVVPDPERNSYHNDFFVQFDAVFKDLKYFCRVFSQHLDTIAIIDSNLSRCDDVRASRNTGSDVERANWRFYTYLQNRMYKLLYPYIDLMWFDSEPMSCDDVIISIATCLRSALKKFPQVRVKHHGRSDFALPIPETEPDFTLKNFMTFMYRDAVRKVARDTIKWENGMFDDRLVPWNFYNFNDVPKFTNIENMPSSASLALSPFFIDHPADTASVSDNQRFTDDEVDICNNIDKIVADWEFHDKDLGDGYQEVKSNDDVAQTKYSFV